MKRLLPILVLCGTSFCFRATAQDTVSSPPMGCVNLTLQGRTDNLISIPLLQEPVAIGHVLVVTSNTVTLDTSGWTVNQYAPGTTQSFYAEISTGQLKGLSYPVVSNTNDTLTFNTGTDNLTQHPLGAVAVGDTVRIRPAWTVGTIFGASDTDIALTPFTTLPTAPQADSGDSLLFFDPANLGIQKVPSSRLVYVQSTGWRTLSDATTDQEGYALPPLSPILVRLHDTTGQVVVLLGDAYQAPALLTLPGGNGTVANDAFVAVAQSEPVSLNNSALANIDPTKSRVKASESITQREDLLLAFDPTRKGFERSPEHIYYYLSSQGWQEVGSTSTTVGDSILLDPTQIYVLRKRANSPGQYWLQNGMLP